MRYIDGQFIAGSETSSFSGFLGKQELIPALDLVIQTMKLGERCLLDIPADLAFTDQ
jgi:FKBP-type peptidyl-prolyl cis-trans isomerase